MAIAVGAEKYGLTDEVLDHAAYKVRIPMVGKANSLNVATSAAIVIYEAVRQRGTSAPDLPIPLTTPVSGAPPDVCHDVGYAS